MILFTFNVTMQIFYLSIILIIIGEALKTFEFINNKFIILYLLIISLLLNFIFHGMTLQTLFESIISVSLSVLLYNLKKVLKK